MTGLRASSARARVLDDESKGIKLVFWFRVVVVIFCYVVEYISERYDKFFFRRVNSVIYEDYRRIICNTPNTYKAGIRVLQFFFYRNKACESFF